MYNYFGSNDWIKNRTRIYSIGFGLLVIIIPCIYIIYTTFVARSATVISIIDHNGKSILSSEQLCYSSGNGIFSRNHLRKLVVDKFDDSSAYVSISDALHQPLISQNYSTLTEFIANVRQAIMSRQLKKGSRSIPTIFHHLPFKDMVRPSCDGLWMEFGVFQGRTLSIIANWKMLYCGSTSQPVYGFDTFTGLPADWRTDFVPGTFAIPANTTINVPKNTVLIKGLFIDTLPIHLRSMDNQSKCHTPVSFIHIDSDLYDSARDVLFLLGSRFVPGTIIVFDELFNYPTYEKYEIKALYEFTSGSNLQLIPLGSSIDIDLNSAEERDIQAFAFVVASQE